MNGLRLKVWPQLVDGLTGEVGNFTLQIADPACNLEDGCVGMGGDEVCVTPVHNLLTLRVVCATKSNQNPYPQPPWPIEIFFEVSGKQITFHTDRETIEANPEGHTSVFINFYPGRAAQENVTIYFVPSMLGESKTNQ